MAEVMEDRLQEIYERPDVRDVVVRRFPSGNWSVIVYRATGIRSLEGKGATFDEALEKASALLEDVAA